MSESSVGNKLYHAGNNAYNGSYVNLHLTMTTPPEFLAGFKEAELNGISKQIVWGADDKGIDVSTPDPTGVYFYVLSTAEASNSNYFPNEADDRKISSGRWWLRSAGNFSYYAAIVNSNGNVSSHGYRVSINTGVRPAFKLGLTSVIFSSSAASGGKPTGVGANLSAATQPTAEQKLTVVDTSTSNLDLDITDQSARTALQGETITIPYTDAVEGGGKFVSCVIEDSTGEIKYYAKLTDTASGTASIDIPATMQAGSYTIKMFNEQCNGDNYTDFASAPIEIDLTVNSLPAIGGGDTATTDTISLFEGYAEHTKTYTIAGTPAPNVTVTSADGTSASITNAGVLTIPTGLAVGNYTIELTATNSQGSATMTVTLTVSDAISYNITVNAGTGGTASGGGSYAENTTATVTATPNSGYRFKQWTENGTAVAGAGASYNFTVTAPRSLTAEFEQDSAPPTTSYTITLGASGNGTVTGGGTHAENTTVTVTAKADTGWHFVNWKENGTVVSTDASYNFTVTGNRSLVAEFEQGLVPIIAVTGIELSPVYWTMQRGFVGQVNVRIIPENASIQDVLWRSSNPEVATVDDTGWIVGVATGTATITATTVDGGFTENCYVTVTRDEIISSGSSSSSSGGTSKPDASPVAGRPFTKPDATRLFNAALAEKPEGGTTLSIKARNYTSVDKTVLAELTVLAQKNGVTLTVHFDTWVNNAVIYRISVNPAVATTNLDLTAKIAGGKITMPKLAIPTEVAVKMPAGMTVETLKITQSGKDITATAKPWLDKNGYVHFTTTGGEIVLSAK